MISVVKLGTTVLKLTVLLFMVFWLTQATYAQVTIPATELDGYAWSSTIGWISLNCKTGGTTGNDICATRSNYKVSINADRTISGYAWSSSIGWIKFDGLATFPTGGGTTATSSRVTGTFPNLVFQGWARACAGTLAPLSSESKNCNSMTMNDNSGSWDGWISLRGTGYTIGTSNTGMTPNSYAWGGPVVGWIDMFTEVTWLNLNPSATLTVSDCVITTAGGASCMASTTWNIQNATVPNVYNVTRSATSSNAVSGSNVMRAMNVGSNTFVARDGLTVLATDFGSGLCGPGLATSSAGTSCVASTTATSTAVVLTPAVAINANKLIARSGDTVLVNWTITAVGTTTPFVLVSGESCTVTGPGMPGVVTVSGSRTSLALRSKSQFTITCTGGRFGSVTDDSIEVELIPTTREV